MSEKYRVFISYAHEDEQIAQAISRFLQEEDIPSFIAVRDIRHQDWAGDIVRAMNRCAIFVVIISARSIESPEVLKEVTLATRICQYILPFRVDRKMLTDSLEYHLAPCQWLDAITPPPLESYIRDLVRKILNIDELDKVYRNSRRHMLLEKMAWPRPLFVGRDEEIKEIERLLAQDHVLFLRGMGGIGKSEIAKAYAKAAYDSYETIIFSSYGGSIRDLVSGPDIEIENLKRGNAEAESADVFFRRKLKAFRELASDKVLLIIDNFDTDWDEHLADLANCPCHLLITTRNVHEDYPEMQIGPIRDFDQVREIFLRHYGRPVPAQEMAAADQIIRLIGMHTITVELIAKQMRASNKGPSSMLSILLSEGLHTGLKEKIRVEGKRASSFEMIRSMFRLSSLSETEKHVMRCMTFVPHAGMDLDFFREAAGLDSLDPVLDLTDRSWLRLEDETDTLSLHPVIADVVREELLPDLDNCASFILNLNEAIGNLWTRDLKERKRLSPFVVSILPRMKDFPASLWKACGVFAINAWICGYFSLSMQSGSHYLDHTRVLFPGDMKKIGQAALITASCYYNSGQTKQAETCYRMAMDCLLTNLSDADTDDDRVKAAESCCKVGRCAGMHGDYEEGIRLLHKASAIYQSVRHIEYGAALLELDRIYMAMGDYETALSYCDRAWDAMHGNICRLNADHPFVASDRGVCLSRLGRCEEADAAFSEAMELLDRFIGPESLQTFRTRMAIAENTIRKKDPEAGFRMAREVILDMERVFGEDNPQVLSFRERLGHWERQGL